MIILKITCNKVELRKDIGSLIRTIGNGDAINADINIDGTLILITTVSGKVELRKECCSLLLTIGHGNVASAKFTIKNILVTTNEGQTEFLKENVASIRTI